MFFSCTVLHVPNPVIASRSINIRAALSESACSVLHMFQCWSSLPCQRNPVHSNTRNLYCNSLPSRWQGRYSSCHCIPYGSPSCLLLGDRDGCAWAFWEMQSFVSDRRMAKWSEQHWTHVTDCHQGMVSCNNNTVFCIFLSQSSLCQSCHTLPLPLFSLSFFFYKPGIWKRLEWLSRDRRRRSWAASKQ